MVTKFHGCCKHLLPVTRKLQVVSAHHFAHIGTVDGNPGALSPYEGVAFHLGLTMGHLNPLVNGIPAQPAIERLAVPWAIRARCFVLALGLHRFI